MDKNDKLERAFDLILSDFHHTTTICTVHKGQVFVPKIRRKNEGLQWNSSFSFYSAGKNTFIVNLLL